MSALRLPVDHRPWPLPGRPWILRMAWRDLAFLHWPVEPGGLAAELPPGLALETFDGAAWLGVVPFRMTGVRPRLLPALPGVSSFPELNLRTYVRAEDKPGVWFFSLDVTKRLAVAVARTAFHLPYFRARMTCERREDTVRYASRRVARGEPPVGFDGCYRATGPVLRAAPGSLEHFLTERYCLYAADRRGRLFRGDVHHAPWPLRPGEVEIERSDLPLQVGSKRLAGRPLVHVAEELDVVAWAPESVGPAGG